METIKHVGMSEGQVKECLEDDITDWADGHFSESMVKEILAKPIPDQVGWLIDHGYPAAKLVRGFGEYFYP